MITIRRAVYEDIPAIMQFIDEHWKKDHICARDREFFEWQFVEDGIVNMILGVDDEAHKIYGIEGFILYNHTNNPDMSGSIWKTIKSENPMLGIEMDVYMYECVNSRYVCASGLSRKATRINEQLGVTMTYMKHFYRLNQEINNYKIAKVVDRIIPIYDEHSSKIKHIENVEAMKDYLPETILMNQIMGKDYRYINKRYFLHPRYRYDVWRFDDDESPMVFVTREENIDDSKCCKLVDCLGDVNRIAELGAVFDNLMQLKEYEYVDVYSFGIDTSLYMAAGMLECNKDSENVIPNYFHPFEQRNIDISIIDPKVPGLRFFLGDGDQDRPC